MKKIFTFQQPVRVIFGIGALENLKQETLGKKALIITTPELKDLGVVDRVKDILKEGATDSSIFSQVQPDPTSQQIDAAKEVVIKENPDFLIGLGGGSAIDFAKALAIAARHTQPIWDYVNLSNRPPQEITSATLPVISIPTTSGTGSEMTPFSVLINTETQQKATIKSPYIYSKIAIIDPQLTVTMPPNITAGTGVDAFAHALESYLNVSNRTPWSDFVAEESISSISQFLKRAVKKQDDMEAREKLAWASVLAGAAIASAGTTVIHAIAQPLSARSGLSHNITVAIFLLPVLKYTLEHSTERFARIAELMAPEKVAGLTEKEKAQGCIDIIEDFLKEVGMFHKMRDFKVSEDIIEQLTGDATTYMSRPLTQHPKQFSKEEIVQICQEAY